MRTTVNTIHTTVLNNLEQVTSRLDRINKQISSGSQLSKPSDDPVNLVGALGLRTSLSSIKQYVRNLDHGESWITTSEGSLTQMKELLLRSKNLAIQAVNASMNSANRLSTADEVRGILDQVVTLANTQLNGRYLFGGFRTTGYTTAEPTPFMRDRANGYRVNGQTLASLDSALSGQVAGGRILAAGDLVVNGADVVTLLGQPAPVSGVVGNGASLAAGDLLINNVDVGVVDLVSFGLSQGLNMGGAAELRDRINAAATGVTASLTTLTAGGAALGDGTQTRVTFDLNGVTVTVDTDGSSNAQVAQDTVDAVNAVRDQTGVSALVGNGTNGGVAGSVVLVNNARGDEGAITISGYTVLAGTSLTGLGNLSQAADSTHNDGRTTMTAASDFAIATSAVDDTVLARIGLAGGTAATGIGGDTAADGLIDVVALGLDLTQSPVQGLAMESAQALAAAFNAPAVTAATGVTASLTTLVAGEGASADTADGFDTNVTFDLNGVSVAVLIPDGSTAGLVAQATVDALNVMASRTGVTAAVGDGTNGGPVNSVVLANSMPGDDAPIVITDYTLVVPGPPDLPGDAATGLGNLSQAADSRHNTGRISLAAANAFAIETSATDDSILDVLGLGGGSRGVMDDANDGSLVYGYRVTSGALELNGIAIDAPVDDGLSTRYADASAAAKAAAVNAAAGQAGVRAEVTPAYLLAGAPVAAVGIGSRTAYLTGLVTNDAILAGQLAINGNPTTTNIATAPPVNGLAMTKAFNAKTVIEATDPGVSVRLTTLANSGLAAAADTPDGFATVFSFDLNGTPISVTIPDGASDTAVAQLTASAINAASLVTGVAAQVGDNTNGGQPGEIVFANSQVGDESAIQVTNFTLMSGDADPGFGNFSQNVDASHNTGQIGIFSDTTFTLSSPRHSDDTILDRLGLGGGSRGYNDLAGDGQITFGQRETELAAGDLVINGVDIFATTRTIQDQDRDGSVVAAINAVSDQTAVRASRDASGRLLLSAIDGRNLQVRTSARGELITHLNGQDPAAPADRVYFGSVRLLSDREFLVEDTLVDAAGDPSELALAGLGLAGGTAGSGEPGDLADDGLINVQSVAVQEGNVRYAGDPDNDPTIKIGQASTLTVGRNGQDLLKGIGVFDVIQGLELALRADHFTTATGRLAATDTTATLAGGGTGLAGEDRIMAGDFTVTITDHGFDPPTQLAVAIGVDPEVDTLDSIAERLNGIPGLSATWSDDGRLQVAVRDTGRYDFAFSGDSSGFLAAVGLSNEDIQVSSLGEAIGVFDTVMEDLTGRISEQGARANRISVQRQIYDNLELVNAEHLSTLQDTDLVKAFMELKSMELRYQAALTAASRIMDLSLVEFMR
ncbi:MAG: flagellar hook-associated protein FlgL [Thermodesulfobacteriota bacterium]